MSTRSTLRFKFLNIDYSDQNRLFRHKQIMIWPIFVLFRIHFQGKKIQNLVFAFFRKKTRKIARIIQAQTNNNIADILYS